MDRRTHINLHKYLDQKRVIFEQSKNENPENCWNNLIIPLTTTWLEITGVKVIKLEELGQSASEPAPDKAVQEGSETRHRTSLSKDDDIVQTTTVKTGYSNIE
jgi:hypothetical protein